MFKKRNLIFICLLILGVFLITGCWLISTPTYTVTFDSQGGSAVDLQTVERGGLVIEPTAPTQTGYAFAGWYKELECTNAWDFNTDTVTSDVTLYAKWVTNAYTVTFDKNGGHTEANPKTKTATHGGNVGTLPTAPTRTGHTFTSWNTKANGSGTKFKATTAVTVDITVYAQWTINTYTVTYNGNGSTGGTVPSDSYHYEPAETVIVLHNTGNLVKTGYTFDGWNTAANGSGTVQAEGSTFAMGVSDVTLYAKWTANNYNITFDKNDTGATGTMADQTIASGSSANLTACGFTKAGWTFAGWAEASDGDVAYADEVSYTMGTADVTLYAKWTPPATYSLRDIGPAGGWIFYDNGSYTTPTATVPSWRYLEAAPSDQSIGALWGCYGVSISGADGTAVGTGEQNTIDILNECATSGIAADICADLSLSGYDDWFLPSKDELNLMYENLKLFVIGGFVGGSYWSSSEGSADYAWTQGFNNGTPDYYGKTSHLRVRAVRAF